MDKFTAILLHVSLMLLQAKANYELHITLYTFTLLRDRCIECNFNGTTTMNEVCDKAPNDRCDVFFNICQKELATPGDSSDCPENQTQTVFNVEPLIKYNQSTVEVFLELTNPIIYSGHQWEGVQFYVEITDQDFIDPDDLIDTLAIDIDIPVGASVSRTTYTGTFNNTQVELSFRVVCAENYYGPNCTRFCNGNSSTCPCDLGYTGEFCETKIEDCIDVQDSCLRIGNCLYAVQTTSYICKCCNTNFPRDCEKEACSNNGNCIQQNDNTYTCVCKTGYTGELCDVPNEAGTDLGCDMNSCSGNGECHFSMLDSSGRILYKCYCDPGFSGTFCEQDRSNDNFSLIGPVVGGILGTVVFVLIVLVTVVLVVLLLRRKGTHKGLSDTAVHNGFTADSSITESTMPLVSSKPSMGHSTIDRDFQNPLYGGGELPDNVYDQTENVHDVTVHSEVHKAQAGGPMMENCLTTKLKDESVYDGDPNQTLRNFKNPVYGDRVDAPTCEEDHAKLKTLKNPIYGNDNDTPGQNSAPQRPHEYADVGPVYASLENQHDRAERYASKAAAEFKITTEGGSAVGVDMATDNRQYEDVV